MCQTAPALSDGQVRRLRSCAQLLDPRGTGGVADTVRALAGVQAQLTQSAALCLRARTGGPDAAGVTAALVADRSVVRAWTMRGTLHLVPAEDLGWLLALYAPVQRARAGRRHRELRLTEDDLTTGVHVIRRALSTHGPMVRSELAEHLAVAGIDPSGQRLIHLINWAAVQGVLCHGVEYDGDPSYVLCEDWLGARWAGEPVAEEAAVAELALRYVHAYGPVGHRDFLAWSGLPADRTRTAWRRVAATMTEVTVAGAPAWMAPGGRSDPVRPSDPAGPAGAGGSGSPAGPGSPGGPGGPDGVDSARPGPDGQVVRLLPSFDTYLLGYGDRGLSVPPDHTAAVSAGGWIRPTVVVDGWTVGTWGIRRRRGQVEVAVSPFGQLDRPVRDALGTEVADLGRFLAADSTLTVT